MSDINSRIQRVIAESGLTKTAFAAKLNVSQQHVSRLSSYGAPSERTIVDICEPPLPSRTTAAEGAVFTGSTDAPQLVYR